MVADKRVEKQDSVHSLGVRRLSQVRNMGTGDEGETHGATLSFFFYFCGKVHLGLQDGRSRAIPRSYRGRDLKENKARPRARNDGEMSNGRRGSDKQVWLAQGHARPVLQVPPRRGTRKDGFLHRCGPPRYWIVDHTS